MLDRDVDEEEEEAAKHALKHDSERLHPARSEGICASASGQWLKLCS